LQFRHAGSKTGPFRFCSTDLIDENEFVEDAGMFEGIELQIEFLAVISGTLFSSVSFFPT
jgi:hypothetical protein